MSVYCFQNICMLFSFQSLRKDHQIHLRHLHHLRQIDIYIYVKKPPDSHNSQKNHFDACIVDNLKIDELVYQNFHQTLNL